MSPHPYDLDPPDPNGPAGGGFTPAPPPPPAGEFLGYYTSADTGQVFDNRFSAGDYMTYNGAYAYWDGARWLDQNGIGLDVSVAFSLDPFADAQPAEWGKPFPIWGVGTGASNPMAFSSHINQQQLLEVTAFMEMNTELEIPLLDDDDNPIIDPAIPPSSYMRWLPLTNTDYVTSPTSTLLAWSDQHTGVRAYVGNSDTAAYDNEDETPAWSHIFRLEKSPVPHWVLRINYAYNRIEWAGTPRATDLRTVVVSVIGAGVGVTTAQTIEVGSASTAGHYRVRKVFWPDQDPNATASDHTRYAQPGLFYASAQVASGGSVSSIAIRSGGGTNQLSLSYMPFVRPYAEKQFNVIHGATMQNWNACTLGVGAAMDGVWQDHFDTAHAKLSIQHPDFDEYNAISVLKAGATYWSVDLYQYLDHNNCVGQAKTLAGGATGYSRHMPVWAYGRTP